MQLVQCCCTVDLSVTDFEHEALNDCLCFLNALREFSESKWQQNIAVSWHHKIKSRVKESRRGPSAHPLVLNRLRNEFRTTKSASQSYGGDRSCVTLAIANKNGLMLLKKRSRHMNLTGRRRYSTPRTQKPRRVCLKWARANMNWVPDQFKSKLFTDENPNFCVNNQ